MTVSFIEIVKQGDEKHYAFACPKCQHIRKRRKDSLAVGLHHLICISCGFSTDAVRLADGAVLEKSNADHRG